LKQFNDAIKGLLDIGYGPMVITALAARSAASSRQASQLSSNLEVGLTFNETNDKQLKKSKYLNFYYQVRSLKLPSVKENGLFYQHLDSITKYLSQRVGPVKY
jgi:hypothetical protein